MLTLWWEALCWWRLHFAACLFAVCSLRCPSLRSVTLSDGEYYEMVKSNFERADRATVVRTTTNYSTSLVPLLSAFKDLLFN